LGEIQQFPPYRFSVNYYLLGTLFTGMTDAIKTAERIIRGKQRKAVETALSMPRTGKEILDRVKATIPYFSYQDLRHILRDFQSLGIAVCLNPERQTGRLYVLKSEAGKHCLPVADIELHAKLRRAKARLAVLQEIARDHSFDNKPLTATQIKKNLRDAGDYSMGLNHVLDALKFLRKEALIEIIGLTQKREMKTYGPTETGKRIAGTIQDTV